MNFVHQVGSQPRLYYDARSTNHQEKIVVFSGFVFECLAVQLAENACHTESYTVSTGKESPTFRNIVLPCGSSSSLDKGTTSLRNVGSQRSIHTASHPIRLKTS